jgi:threonine/homoserine/homoserine lactone efflux protein
MLQILIQFPIGFFIALSGVLIPGPLLAYTVAKSSTYGARTGPLTVVGHVLVELVVLSLIGLGLGIVLRSQAFQVGLGLVGGSMLVIMGVLSISKLTRSPDPRGVVVTRYHPLLGGVMFSTILNPTVIIWWATIGLVTLMEAFLIASLAGVAFWLVGHFLADLSWFSLVSLSVARGRKFLGSRGYRALLLVCGGVLLVLGVYLVGKYGLPLLLL